MRTSRQLHIFLGVFFAPLLIYFALSGAWQVFRFNDVPKDGTPAGIRQTLHALSSPHTHATFPGADPKLTQSVAFKLFELLMCAGFIVTAVLGLQMAFQMARRRRTLLLTALAGAALPLLFLLL